LSYSFRLRASGGSVQVETTTGTIPDGEFAVSGHEDEQAASIGVTRLSTTGIAVAGAQCHALKSFTAKADS
jgi:hypothetical protein